MTTCASKSGSRHLSRVVTASPSSAAEPPASTKSLWQASAIAPTTSSIWVSWMSATSLRPSMPPAALHQSVKTLAVVSSCGSLVKPTSVSTPAMIWLEVTPWSVAPVALPPWQASVTVPKAGPVDAADVADPVADEEADDDAGRRARRLRACRPGAAAAGREHGGHRDGGQGSYGSSHGVPPR